MAIERLKLFHDSFSSNKYEFLGSERRKIFCELNFRKLADYPFSKLYDKILEIYDTIRDNMD